MSDIFAYETDGFGGQYFMDDANVPVGHATEFRTSLMDRSH